MADYTVTIILTDSNDKNGPNHFNYVPGSLQVHRGDRVRFTCNQAFTLKFPHGSPFEAATRFAMNTASTTAYVTIDQNAVRQVYHYIVAALDANHEIHLDAGCPSIDVL
jgi:hypothetical protein